MKEPRVVAVRFKDHSSGDGNTTGLIECVVYGLLYEETEESLKVATWHEVSVRPAGDPNADVITILKHPGLQIVELRARSVSVLGKGHRGFPQSVQCKRRGRAKGKQTRSKH